MGKLFFIVTAVTVCTLLLLVTVAFLGQNDTDCTYTNLADEAKCPVGACRPVVEDNYSITVETDLPVLNPDLPFVGREREVAEISTYMHSEIAYVIGVHGPPAFGKSTLAIHVGYEMVKRGTSVRYVDASETELFQHSYTMEQTHGQPSTATSMQKHAGHLQPHTEHTWSEVKKLVCQDKDSFCGSLLQWARDLNRKAVLVLDNFDAVLRYHKEKLHGLIKELLENSDYRYLSIIVTSQTKVKFIDVKSASYDISELSPEASVVLLKSLVSNDCNMTNEEGEKVAAMVGHCPLALKVIAVVLNEVKSVSPLMKELTKGAVLLTISPEDLQANQRFTVVMDIAYSHLPDNLRNCAKLIAMFPGSFGEEAGETILKGCGQTGQVCLQSLERRSLIQRYLLGEEYRYQLHRLIREYFANFTTGTGANDTEFLRAYKSFFTDYFVELLNNTNKDDATIRKYEIEHHNWNALFKLYLETVRVFDMYLTEENPLPATEAVTLVLGYIKGFFPQTVCWKRVILHLLDTHEHASVIHQMLGEVSSLLREELFLDYFDTECGRTEDIYLARDMEIFVCTCKNVCEIATTCSLITLRCMKLVPMCCLCTITEMWYSESFSYFMFITFIIFILFACYKI